MGVYNGKKRFNLESVGKTGQELENQDQLLQVQLPDKIMIYDLKSFNPKEVYCIFNTDFFAEQENFVDLGLDEYWTKINDKWTQFSNDKTREYY